MAKSDPYCPDQHFAFLRGIDERTAAAVVDQLASAWQMYTKNKILTPNAALVKAYREAMGDRDVESWIEGKSANVFRNAWREALERVQADLEELIAKYVAVELKDILEPIDIIASCNEPERLIAFYLNNGVIAEDRQRVVLNIGAEHDRAIGLKEEVVRKLYLSMVYLAAEFVDPTGDVSFDLTHLNELYERCLFASSRSWTVHVGALLNDAQDGIAGEVLIEDQARGLRTNLRSIIRPYECRLVMGTDCWFLVQSTSRPKGFLPSIIKSMRGRPSIDDRRGSRHVLVAISCDQGATFRAAAWEDCERYEAHLWDAFFARQGFTRIESEGPPNPESIKGFRKKTIKARYERPCRRGSAAMITPVVEQQIVDISTDLLVTHDAVPFSHDRYEYGRMAKHIAAFFWWYADSVKIELRRELERRAGM